VERDVLREVAVTGLPILGAALSEPLLTLVDTAFVGRAAAGATLALAALSINCGLYNFLSNSFSWLVTAVTNTLAAALAREPAGEAGGEASRLLGNALLLAAGLAIPLTCVVFAFPDAVLGLYGAPLGSELARAAAGYLWIRACSVPSTLLMFVAVGAFLGKGSVATPATGIALAAAVNLAGDALLVPSLGLPGAAAATAAASWAGTLYVLWRLPSGVAPPRFSRPRAADVAPLLAVSGALLLSQLTSSAVYSLTTSRAAAAGAAHAAAHQIQLQLWWLLSYVPVPLYLAAQTTLGRDLARGDVRRASATITVLARLGAALSIGLAAVNCALPAAAAPSFSSDPAVLAALAASLPAAVAAQLLATINTTAEGVFAGVGGLRHVASVSVLSAVIGAAAMLAAPNAWGLMGPWMGLLAFEAVRTVAHAAAWRGMCADVAAGRARGAVPV
jgi:putative MATE family efflux protein